MASVAGTDAPRVRFRWGVGGDHYDLLPANFFFFADDVQGRAPRLSVATTTTSPTISNGRYIEAHVLTVIMYAAPPATPESPQSDKARRFYSRFYVEGLDTMRTPESPETPASEVTDPFFASPTRMIGTKIQKDDFYIKRPQRNIQSEWAGERRIGAHETQGDSTCTTAPASDLAENVGSEEEKNAIQAPEKPLPVASTRDQNDEGVNPVAQQSIQESLLIPVDEENLSAREVEGERAYETKQPPDIFEQSGAKTADCGNAPTIVTTSDDSSRELLDAFDDLPTITQTLHWDHLERLQAWDDVQQTSTLLAIYLAAWTFDLLLPTLIVSTVTIIMSPSLREACLPKTPRKFATNKNGSVTTAAKINEHRRPPKGVTESAIRSALKFARASNATSALKLTTLASLGLIALLLSRCVTAYAIYKTASAFFGVIFFSSEPAWRRLHGATITGTDRSAKECPQDPDDPCKTEGVGSEVAEISSHATR